MIAHIDVDAFFASVIVRKNPRLRGKPLLALGMGGGCVIAASYEAKAKGVKTGMRLIDALKLAPDAIRVLSDFNEAGRASEEIETLLRRQCPILEQASIDEWFLDLQSLVGGVPKDLVRWATETQQMLLRKTALTVSIGTGPSKTLAKMASEYRKPAGITILREAQNSNSETTMNFRNSNFEIVSSFEFWISDFLKDRPAAAIPGIGRKRVLHTDARGWKTAWDIAQAPAGALDALFGKSGVELKEELLGNPVSSVTSDEAPPKSVSRCRSFRATKDRALLWAHLLRHAEYTMLKMRRHHLACRGVSVWLRDGEYNGGGANASLPQPAHTEEAILPFIRQCFERSFDGRMTYTQVGLALWHLIPAGAPQYSLFEAPERTERDEAIQDSLDLLHARFGRNSITRGSAMAVKTGTKVTVDMPMYE